MTVERTERGLVARPRARGPRPAIVFLNAATGKGLDAPYVARLLGNLSRVGFLAVAPQLPGLAEGEITPLTLETAIEAVRDASGGGRVALLGASTGAGLALLAAADPRLARRVTVVGAVAPFADLRTVVARATLDRDAAPRTLVEGVARSLRACGGGAAGEAVLANRDAARVDALLGELPAEARAALDRLSPIRHAACVRAPVLLAAAPDDPFFPLTEARALADALPAARLTVSRSLDHVRPRLGAELLPLLGFLRRFLLLAAASRPEPVVLRTVAA
jgi:pimeloyl-ACP methyl ester carboxylesterase